MIQTDYVERIYAGVLGKCIGVRLGAPVEPIAWTYDRIRNAYGEINGYLKDYRTFAADDDVNGPVFFVRSVIDSASDRPVTSEDVGNAWLNYTRDGKGFFWWGGFGVSTEHTAYVNLTRGITAPHSGSMRHNGAAVAEQIGGQIFVDCWGLVSPRDPRQAAELAETAASVSHDGNGVYGARFIAAAIAIAFEESDPARIVAGSRRFVPDESEYARVVDAVVRFHADHPEEFRSCREYLAQEFGYDRYPGACHIIPNAGVCVLALLYGRGALSRTVEIATMCGWDTDCNAGNVGTIIGVAGGLRGVDQRYREPINDLFVGSSVAGSLNMIDLPRFSRELAILGYRLAGEVPAPSAAAATITGSPKDLFFDFDLPGSTHGFRGAGDLFLRLRHQREVTTEGSDGALEVLVDGMPRSGRDRVYVKPFYRRDDFSDDRYLPAFSPLIYEGQTISLDYYWEPWEGENPALAFYIRRTDTKELIEGPSFFAEPGEWRRRSWTISAVDAAIDEIGVIIENREEPRVVGKLYLDSVRIGGTGLHRLDFSKQTVEFGEITQCTTSGGAWTLEDGGVHAFTADTGSLYTGNYYTSDVHIRSRVQPHNGSSHLVVFRARGTRLGYAGGLSGEGRVAILKNENGYREVASKPFAWRHGETYDIEITAVGSTLTLSIDGSERLTWTDTEPHPYGMYGFAQLSPSRTHFGYLEARQL